MLLFTALLVVDLAAPARELAGKISTLAGGQEMVLSVRAASSVNAADARRALETELRQRGVKLGPAGVELRVTLAENAREHVWTA
ncbi:MAG: hypothetical protein ACRD96_13770, partial [Bryobacteraceae bacterium]